MGRCFGGKLCASVPLALATGERFSTGKDQVGPQMTMLSGWGVGEGVPLSLPHCWMLARACCMGLRAPPGLNSV